MSLLGSEIGEATQHLQRKIWFPSLMMFCFREQRSSLQDYEFEACPFSQQVRESLTELDLEAEI